MGILELLIHLEELRVVVLGKDGGQIVYGMDERKLTPRQVKNLDRRVRRLLDSHKELLLRWLPRCGAVDGFIWEDGVFHEAS